MVGYFHEGEKSYTDEQIDYLKREAKAEFDRAEGTAPFAAKSRCYPATTSELLTFAQRFFGECIDIAESKNRRYAKPDDPFSNFRRAGPYGIAVRSDDKVSRLLNLTLPGATIDDAGESIEDSCRDLANYMMLLAGLRANERGK